MSKFKRLGRGMKDISHLFLSSEEEHFIVKKEMSREDIRKKSEHKLTNKYICLVGEEQHFQQALLVMHLSLALAQVGMSVALVDIDEKLSCLCSFIDNKEQSNKLISADNFIEKGPLGVKLVGLNKKTIENLISIKMKDRILFGLEKMEEDVDLVLISAMQETLLKMNTVLFESMKEFIIFVSPDNNKMLEAYRTIKAIFSRNPMANVGTVITDINHIFDVDSINNKMYGAVNKFLDKELHKYGFIYRIKREQDTAGTTASLYEDDLAACISNIAQTIMLRSNLKESLVSPGLFFRNMFAEYASLRREGSA